MAVFEVVFLLACLIFEITLLPCSIHSFKRARAIPLHCRCSLCLSSGKYKRSIFYKITTFSWKLWILWISIELVLWIYPKDVIGPTFCDFLYNCQFICSQGVCQSPLDYARLLRNLLQVSSLLAILSPLALRDFKFPKQPNSTSIDADTSYIYDYMIIECLAERASISKVTDLFLRRMKYLTSSSHTGGRNEIVELFREVSNHQDLVLWHKNTNFVMQYSEFQKMIIEAHVYQKPDLLPLQVYFDYKFLLEFSPTFLEELLQQAFKWKHPNKDRMLDVGLEMVCIIQRLVQAIPLKKGDRAIQEAKFLQLAHFRKELVTYINFQVFQSKEQKGSNLVDNCGFRELHQMKKKKRKSSWAVFFSVSEVEDIQRVLERIPTLTVKALQLKIEE